MKKSLFLSIASFLGLASTGLAATVPENLRSPHFRAMYQHLDLGGVLYGYVDIDGDLEKLIHMGQGFFDFARKSDPEEFPMELDLKRILKATGLDGIKGIGVSSYKDGSRFRNKMFVLAPGERRGLLKIGGGEPHAFKTWSLAPAGSDIVIEQDLNAKAIYEMALEIAGIVMGDEGQAMIAGQMKQPIPGMGFTFEKVINDLDLTLSVVVDMQENRPLKIPDSPGDGVNIPLTDAIVTIDKLGWLFDHLAPLAKEESELRVFRDLQWEGIEVVDEAPGDFKIYKPALLKHLRTGKLVLTTRREFAELCFSEKQSLADDPKFQAAMKGLPQQGNGFAYLSTTLHKTIEGIVKQIPEEEMGGMEAGIAMSVMSFFIPGKDGPEASVTVNVPAGFYTVGNSGSSLKAGFATGALAGPMLVGYGALMPMMFMSSVAPEEKWAEADEAVEVEADAIEFGPEVEFNNQIPPQFVPRDEIKKENLRKENKEIDRIRRQLELQERGVKRTSPRGD